MRQFNEHEWKIFRELRLVALDRYCRRVLDEVERLLAATGHSNHERCVDLFDLIKERKREMANTFDDVCRSDAFMCIALMRSLGLFSEEEFARFSEQTRLSVQMLVDIRAAQQEAPTDCPQAAS